MAAGTGNDIARGLQLPVQDALAAADVITNGTVRVIDANSSPAVSLVLGRRQASSRREPAGLPAHVEAALAPSPKNAADAAALGTGEPVPQVAALLQVAAARGLGLAGVATDPAPAAPVGLATVVVVGLVTWLLFAVRR